MGRPTKWSMDLCFRAISLAIDAEGTDGYISEYRYKGWREKNSGPSVGTIMYKMPDLDWPSICMLATGIPNSYATSTRWTRDQCLDALRTAIAEVGHSSYIKITKYMHWAHDRNVPSSAVVISRLGKWRTACEEATGVKFIFVHHRNGKYWDDQDCVNALRQCNEEGNMLIQNRYDAWVDRQDKFRYPSSSTVVAIMGTWGQAQMEAVGYTWDNPPVQTIQMEIKRLWLEIKRPPTIKEWGEWASRRIAVNSWRNHYKSWPGLLHMVKEYGRDMPESFLASRSTAYQNLARIRDHATPRQLTVLSILDNGGSLSDAARLLNLSRERIRQIAMQDAHE